MDPKRRNSFKLIVVPLYLTLFLLAGCSAQQGPAMETVENLDLDRFMGQWHVLADISTPFDRDAFVPLESYTRVGQNIVETVYSYREGKATGPLRERHLKAFVSDESNAVWAMQIFWPIKAEYRVVFVDPDYQTTIVGRSKRDFVWVMSRAPEISEPALTALLQRTRALGYDLSKLRLHQSPNALDTGSSTRTAPEPLSPQ